MSVLQTGVMLPLKEKDKALVQKLLAAGSCPRCVLRFCCLAVQAAYRQPEQVSPHPLPLQPPAERTHAYVCSSHAQETLKELQAFITEAVQEPPESTEEDGSHDPSGPEPPSKRAKFQRPASEEDAAAAETLQEKESRVCVVCLGVLQEFCDIAQATKVCVCVDEGERS